MPKFDNSLGPFCSLSTEQKILPNQNILETFPNACLTLDGGNGCLMKINGEMPNQGHPSSFSHLSNLLVGYH